MKRFAPALLHCSLPLFGVWLLANWLVSLALPGFSADFIWIRLHALPALAKPALGLLMILVWAKPEFQRARTALRLLAAAFALEAAVNVIGYYQALYAGEIQTWLPVPLSLFVAAMFLGLRRFLADTPYPVAGRPVYRWAAGVAAMVLTPSLCVGLHLLTYGSTDYSRPADAAVVLGARVYDDGRLSLVLWDRLSTAVDLYKRGLVPVLILSGGTGANGINEAEAMREAALDLGVPDAALVLDRKGDSTAATLRNAAAIADDRGMTSLLAVSNDYHLARIKLLGARSGRAVYTVPARETRFWPAKVKCVAREFAVFGYYYLAPLLPVSTERLT